MKYLIAGNWKMNKTVAEAVDVVSTIHQAVGRNTGVSIVVCPPFPQLDRLSHLLDKLNSTIQLGAQNMHHETSGAYTGEVAAGMLREFFCTHVILGHSERRQYFGETDALINQKICTAQALNLKPILCIGESIEQREAGQTLSIIEQQLKGCLQGIELKNADELIIAYEPIWAIGTGKTATPAMAEEVHQAISQWLVQRFGSTLADKIRLLYGGSMKPENAAALLDQPHIHGGLIGGASLKAADFAAIVRAAEVAVAG